MTDCRVLAIIVSLILIAPAHAQVLDFEHLTAACLEQEEYRIGGAALGDCYRDHAARIEADIVQRLDGASARFDATARNRIAASHQHWLDYRAAYCGFVEDFPGNTQAWVNASACMLELTHNRLGELEYLGFAKRMGDD